MSEFALETEYQICTNCIMDTSDPKISTSLVVIFVFSFAPNLHLSPNGMSSPKILPLLNQPSTESGFSSTAFSYALRASSRLLKLSKLLP